MPRKSRHLTIAEKRDFFAKIARDTTGEFTMADKFKAIVEDTKTFQIELDLAAAQAKREEEARALERQPLGIPAGILQHLPPPIPQPLATPDHPHAQQNLHHRTHC